jgi:rSAM/selenodomain-associated transferase 1
VIIPVIIPIVSEASARSSNTLLVFAKKPVPGTVKTRLARDVGHEEAARLYRLMAETTWSRTAGPGYERWLVFEPSSERDWMRDWLPGADSYLPQVPGDLGTRLSAAFEHAFQAGAKRVAVIGTDSPNIRCEDITGAFDLLQDGHQAVLGPSTDGGYWLLGLSSFQPHLFEDILWSTDEVARQTRARMAARGLRFAELRTVRDIDRVDDLASLWKDLGA